MKTRWRPLPRLLAISPGDHLRGRNLPWVVEGAVQAGLQLLVVREPHLDVRSLVRLVRRLGPLLDEGLILHASNPHAIEIAIRCKTGLHLPSHMDPGPLRPQVQGWMGQSCHSPLELAGARRNGCDYVTLSPVFTPISKPGDPRSCLGEDGLQRLCSHTDLPVLALGGVTPERVAICIGSGAYGIASLGGIFPPECTPEEAGDQARLLYTALCADSSTIRPRPLA